MNALATINQAPAVTTEQLDLVKRTVANGASEAELKLFLFDCQRQGVHPLDKLLHFTKRGGKYTPITSIDFMRTRAADSGEYAGSDDAVFTGTPKKDDFAASVTVWRLVQGQRCPFSATARWSEYKPAENAFMWDRMGHTMLAKCAEGLALRKGFPRQLAGLYAKEELDQAETTPARPAFRPVRSMVVGASGEPDAPMPEGVNIETGEELTAPPGYYFVRGYTLNNGWHEFQLLNYDAQGGAIKLSTKKAIGALAAQAEADGIPVKVKTSPKKNSVGEAYLDDIQTLKSAKPSAPLIEVDEKDLAF